MTFFCCRSCVDRRNNGPDIVFQRECLQELQMNLSEHGLGLANKDA